MKKENKPDFFEHPAEEMLWEWMHGYDQRVLDHLNRVTPMEAACLMVEFMGYAVAKNVGFGVVKRLSDTLAAQADAAVMQRQINDAMHGQNVQDLSAPKPIIMEIDANGQPHLYTAQPMVLYLVDTSTGENEVNTVLTTLADMDQSLASLRAQCRFEKYPVSMYQREGHTDLNQYDAWRDARRQNDPDWLLKNS